MSFAFKPIAFFQQKFLLTLLCVSGMVLSGCTAKPSDLSSLVGAPAALSTSGGSGSTATGNSLLATFGNGITVQPSSTQALTATAVSGAGVALNNVVVTFTVFPSNMGTLTSTGAPANSVTATTNSLGIATVTFNSGVTTGPFSVQATSSAGSCIYTSSVGSSSSAPLIIQTGTNPSTITTAGSQLLQLVAYDSHGAAITNTSVVFTLVGNSSGTFPGPASSASTTTDTNGTAFTTFTPSATTGTMIIMATVGSYAPIFFTVNVNAVTAPTKLVMSTNTPFTNANTCAGPVTITSTDAAGDALAVTGATTVNLSESGTGTFYSDSGCTSSETTTTIAAHTSSIGVYFKTTLAQTENLFATFFFIASKLWMQ